MQPHPTPGPGPCGYREGGHVIQLGQIKGRDFRSMEPMRDGVVDALSVWGSEVDRESLPELGQRQELPQEIVTRLPS